MKKNIKLINFIIALGDTESAVLFNVSIRAIQAWRLGERRPDRDNYKVIISKTKRHRLGQITYEGIY